MSAVTGIILFAAGVGVGGLAAAIFTAGKYTAENAELRERLARVDRWRKLQRDAGGSAR